MATKISSKVQLNPFDKNPIEAIRDSGANIVRQASTTLKSETREDISRAWRQLLGTEANTTKKNRSGELQEGEELVLVEKTVRKLDIEPAINYTREIIHAETTIRSQDNRELRIRMDQLRIEISKLAKSSRELQVVAKDISLDTLPENPGKLHVNFFEWIIIQLQVARMRVENSVSWFNTLNSKKSKKDFWTLAKKHGTSFSLSGERQVAQQVG